MEHHSAPICRPAQSMLRTFAHQRGRAFCPRWSRPLSVTRTSSSWEKCFWESDMYLGIDLGTSNSAIVGNEKGSLRLFKTSDGRDVLPSMLYVDRRGSRFVGSR